jgi:hypothetical protein
MISVVVEAPRVFMKRRLKQLAGLSLVAAVAACDVSMIPAAPPVPAARLQLTNSQHARVTADSVSAICEAYLESDPLAPFGVTYSSFEFDPDIVTDEAFNHQGSISYSTFSAADTVIADEVEVTSYTTGGSSGGHCKVECDEPMVRGRAICYAACMGIYANCLRRTTGGSKPPKT